MHTPRKKYTFHGCLRPGPMEKEANPQPPPPIWHGMSILPTAFISDTNTKCKLQLRKAFSRSLTPEVLPCALFCIPETFREAGSDHAASHPRAGQWEGRRGEGVAGATPLCTMTWFRNKTKQNRKTSKWPDQGLEMSLLLKSLPVRTQ